MVEQKLKKQVFDKLLDSHKFDVPQALIDSEMAHIRQQSEQRQQPVPDEKTLAESGHRQVALGFTVIRANQALRIKKLTVIE